MTEDFSLIGLFYAGGIWIMFILTLLVICLFLAAWKKPQWVLYIGILSLSLAFIYTLCRICAAGVAIQKTGTIPRPGIIGATLYHWTIPLIYAMGIFLISLILKMLRKQ
jgi:hypothetical protein